MGLMDLWPFRRKEEPPAESGAADEALQVLAVLSMEEVNALGGLPSEAMIGLVGKGSKRPKLSAKTFRPNPTFSAFMHHVIDTFGRHDPELKEAARQQVRGSVCVIDLRTPEGVMGHVPPEDIIGMFEVASGKLGTYHPNDKHVLFSENGEVQLPPALQALHIRELLRLKVDAGTSPRDAE